MHELEDKVTYRKTFVVWLEDWNEMRKISNFLNLRNKIKVFEALWVANNATRDVSNVCGSLPKNRDNVKVPSKS